MKWNNDNRNSKKGFGPSNVKWTNDELHMTREQTIAMLKAQTQQKFETAEEAADRAEREAQFGLRGCSDD
jgi:hypothetical protein